MTRGSTQPEAVSVRQGWLPGIEALRGIAALSVVVHHSWSLSTRPQFPGYWIVEGFGSWGVNLFFLLSGYLLCAYFWRPRDERSLRIYGVRRFARIAPAYYVNIVILFTFFAQYSLLFSEAGVKQVLANATFTQYLFPSTSSSLNVNGALWTLTAEFFLYLFLPLMALPFSRWPIATFTALLGIGVGWRLWVALDGGWLRALYFGEDSQVPLGIQSLFLSRQFIGLLPIFAIGIALRWITEQGALAWLQRPNGGRAIGIVLLALIPSVMWLFLVEPASDYQNAVLFTLFDYVTALLLVLPLAVAALPNLNLNSALGRVSVWLGDRSYSLYLWHFPIILVIYGRGSAMLPPQTSHIAVRLVLIFGLSLVFAHFSYRLIERPGMAWGRRVVHHLREASTAGVPSS